MYLIQCGLAVTPVGRLHVRLGAAPPSDAHIIKNAPHVIRYKLARCGASRHGDGGQEVVLGHVACDAVGIGEQAGAALVPD